MGGSADAVGLLQRLIGFATVSRASNLELIGFVADHLDRLGAQVTVLPSRAGTKANLHAVMGPADVPGIALSGHSDVVPVDHQPWTVDPFAGRLIEDRVYGRGSTDMKGFIACTLEMFAAAAGRRLSRPLHLVLSFDEEIGCVGIREALPRLAGLETAPDLCIVGEPTSMGVSTAHKGKLSGHWFCRGTATHSASPDLGINAIHLAADLIGEIRGLQRTLIEKGDRNPAFGVPWTTLHVGTIDGGTAVNIVPDRCRLGFEIRHLPGDDPDRLLEQLDAAAAGILDRYTDRAADAGIDFRIDNRYPGLALARDHHAARYVRSLASGGDAGSLDYGTEAGLLHDHLGWPTVVCGPGSMRQGHRADEFVELEQLRQCRGFLARLLDDCTVH